LLDDSLNHFESPQAFVVTIDVVAVAWVTSADKYSVGTAGEGLKDKLGINPP
jgi:hypothetical protein